MVHIYNCTHYPLILVGIVAHNRIIPPTGKHEEMRRCVDMIRAKRKRSRAHPGRVERLPRQFTDDEFPATVITHRRGKAVVRLLREADYQEVIGLMADHLKHLADEGEKNAITLDEVTAKLEARRAARTPQREDN